MTNTYKFTINKMDCFPSADSETNVVFVVYFTIDATNGTGYARSTGQASFDYTEGQPFTPFSELTESQVEQWVNSKVNIQSIKDELDLILSEQPLPEFVTLTPPWA